MAVAPKVVTEGVSKWSLNPDDNATADERINWQEGMMPGVVNNSARMMMTRIKEQYNLDQTQFKSITDAVNSKFGNKIKDIVADSYTITKESTPGHWTINFIFNDQVTLAEYNDYKAQKLYFLTRLLAANINSNSSYQTWTYNSIIAINLTFVINGTQYVNNMEFYLNFFGIDKYNNVITLHELKHFVNCTTLQRGNGGLTTNLISIPMERTYVNSKLLPVKSSDDWNLQQWYYISPAECIVTHYINLYNSSITSSNEVSIGIFNIAPQILQITRQYPAMEVYLFNPSGTPTTNYSINYYTIGGGPFRTIGKILLTGSPTELKDYPMSLTPQRSSLIPPKVTYTRYTSIYPVIV